MWFNGVKLVWMLKGSLFIVIGVVIIVLMLLMMIFLLWFVMYDFNVIDLIVCFLLFFVVYWFGIDEVGCDLFSCVLVGS